MARTVARASVELGFAFAALAALVSFIIALAYPYYYDAFWWLTDGEAILRGHWPITVGYAIASGPVVAHEWSFEVMLALAARAHAYGWFAIGCALAAAATPLLAYAAARAFGTSDAAAAVAAALTVGSRLMASAMRPETFAVDACVLEIALLARGRGRGWIVPLAIAWANVHASAILAPVLVVLFATGDAIVAGRIDAKVRRSAAVAFVVALATLITPLGVRLWSYAFALALAPSPAREHLEAWRALTLDSPGVLATLVPSALVLAVCGLRLRRERATELLLALTFAALTVTHGRYAMFLAVAWVPAIARAIDDRARTRIALARAPLVALAPLACFALVVAGGKRATPFEPRGPWQAGAAIVSDYRLHGNTYAPLAWASFLHVRRLPVRLLIDAHSDCYAADVWDDHLALQEARPNWRAVLRRRAIVIVVLPRSYPLVGSLATAPDWRLVAERDGVDVFSKTNRSPGRISQSSSAPAPSSTTARARQ